MAGIESLSSIAARSPSCVRNFTAKMCGWRASRPNFSNLDSIRRNGIAPNFSESKMSASTRSVPTRTTCRSPVGQARSPCRDPAFSSATSLRLHGQARGRHCAKPRHDGDAQKRNATDAEAAPSGTVEALPHRACREGQYRLPAPSSMSKAVAPGTWTGLLCPRP